MAPRGNSSASCGTCWWYLASGWSSLEGPEELPLSRSIWQAGLSWARPSPCGLRPHPCSPWRLRTQRPTQKLPVLELAEHPSHHSPLPKKSQISPDSRGGEMCTAIFNTPLQQAQGRGQSLRASISSKGSEGHTDATGLGNLSA